MSPQVATITTGTVTKVVEDAQMHLSSITRIQSSLCSFIDSQIALLQFKATY